MNYLLQKAKWKKMSKLSDLVPGSHLGTRISFWARQPNYPQVGISCCTLETQIKILLSKIGHDQTSRLLP